MTRRRQLLKSIGLVSSASIVGSQTVLGNVQPKLVGDVFPSPDFDGVSEEIVWTGTDSGTEHGSLGRKQAEWNGEAILWDIHETNPSGDRVYVFELAVHSETYDRSYRRTYTTQVDLTVDLLNRYFSLYTTIPEEREDLDGGSDGWLDLSAEPFGVGVSLSAGSTDDAYILPGPDNDRGTAGFGHVRWTGEETPDTYVRAGFVVVVDDSWNDDPGTLELDWEIDVDSRRSRTRIGSKEE